MAISSTSTSKLDKLPSSKSIVLTPQKQKTGSLQQIAQRSGGLLSDHGLDWEAGLDFQLALAFVVNIETMIVIIPYLTNQIQAKR